MMQKKLDNTSYITYTIVGINLMIFLYMLLKFGTTTSVEALVQMGAKSNIHIVFRHEFWRLLSAAFIHIGFEHLLFNNLSIYFIGMDLEKLMGHLRFIVLFIFSSLGGNLFSFAFNSNVSAGASTGIFGLFISYVVLAQMYPHLLALKQRATSFSILIILNIVTGVMGTGVDNWGHIGGAIFGGLITLLIGLDKRYSSKINWKIRLGSLVILILLSLLLLYFGFQKVL
ncbi:rhomboid family intramembrane serine protease [Facklamia sp. DSM 111018]|uniref:Rhomboid family intramembrane serine protease n=1 Tax=Facklamia lactis TaxID=2749967 RepID=A0ABS0LPA0_9LACT|nr:rhomboid family intramembrane serine protease [Facklamia lactis]MBG9985869.1 rhomboid family intramembrane serine protease [Facklamia lactis]